MILPIDSSVMSATPPPTSCKPVTLKRLRQMAKAGEKIAAITCYDATTARLLDAAGMDVLLAGDSAAQVILGFDSSIHAPLDFMIQITAAVKRGAPRCFVMADMPFMSYQADDAEAIRNAGRFMTEGLADCVKLEVNAQYGDLVAKLARAGIPVVAHIGWKPQTARFAGVRTAVIAGRTAREAEAMLDEAQLMEARGAAMLLIEQCPAEVAEYIVKHTSIPVIGCGAGRACHGHVAVLQDVVGMTWHSPSFVQPVARGNQFMQEAAEHWVRNIRSGEYLREHPYAMDEGEAAKLKKR